jgi:lysophospholipase L1-like esterase
MRIRWLSFLLLCIVPLSCGGKGTIVFLGDSITQEGNKPGGYVDLIRQEFPDSTWRIVGAGISGNKVPDLEARLEKDVLSHSPSLVVIYIGINDVWHYELGIGGTSKERYESGLRDLCARIAASDARVILCTPSVVGEKTANSLDPMLDAYADITRAVAASTGSTLCDLRKAFRDELKRRNLSDAEKGILTRDRVHLNDEGNRFVAKEIMQSLRTLGITPPERSKQ